MAKPPDLSDRIRGCILLGAIGDALGGPYEGQTAPIEYRDHERPWQVSDDTQLTLATCEVVTETGAVSPASVAANFVKWFRARRFRGLGASTLKALRDLDAGAHWALAGAKGERAAGAGAASRVAPLAYLIDPADEGNRRTLRDICRITHHHDEAYIGALAVLIATRLAASDDPPTSGEWLPRIAETLPDSVVRDRLLAIGRAPRGTSLRRIAEQFGCSGYVAEAAPLAIYAAGEFADAAPANVIRGIIEAGGDTDTTAAIAGQILGARLGLKAIPEEVIDSLADRDEILCIAECFAARLTQSIYEDPRRCSASE